MADYLSLNHINGTMGCYRRICIKHLATSNRYSPIHPSIHPSTHIKANQNGISIISEPYNRVNRGFSGMGGNGMVWHGMVCLVMVWGFCCNGARIFRLESVWVSLWVSEQLNAYVCVWIHQWIVRQYYKPEHTQLEREQDSGVDRDRSWRKLCQRILSLSPKMCPCPNVHTPIPLGGWARHKDIDRPIKITVVDCEWHVMEEIRRCFSEWFCQGKNLI